MRFMDRNHEVHFFCEMENLLQDTCGSGSAVRRSKQLPDLIFCGVKFGPACQKEKTQKKEKQEWAMEKRKLDNARKLRGIYFIYPEDGEREAIKNARKKLEILMEAAMPCTTGTKKCLKKLRETVSEGDESNQNSKRQSMHASWKLVNPRESVWNPFYHKIMKITSQVKDTIR